MAVSIKTEQKKHQYTQLWDDSDVVLFAEVETFYVHSTILSFASPVFKSMLSTIVEEESEKVINLPEKRKKDILNLLNIIYPVDFAITDFSCCESLLEIAREYDVKKVTMLVDDFLNSKVDCSFDVIKLAESFDLKDTLNKNVVHFAKAINGNNRDYFGSDWTMISLKSKVQILVQKSANFNLNGCCPENKYCDHNIIVSKKEFQTLFDVIKALEKCN